MAIQFEKSGKVTTLGGQDPKVKMPVAPQVRRLGHVQSLRLIDLENLEKSRGKYVAGNRGNNSWMGAWYKAEDWDADGKLVAAGEARARALDPWANDRAAGRDSVDGLTGKVIARPSLADLMRMLDGGSKPVTKVVTKVAPRIESVTKIVEAVTKAKKKGRPTKTGKSMTDAERMKAYRVRRSAKPKE